MSSTDTQGISDEQIDSLWLEHRPPGLSSEEQYRSARKFARAVLVLQPEPTVEQAIAYLKIALRDSKGWTMDYSDAIIRDAIDRVPEAAMGVEPIKLNIIRNWPDGFQDRLHAVWLDVVSYIPNVKLWDLQRVLANFGFRMEIYEDAAPSNAPAVDCDQAFEEKYKTSSRDPSNEGDLAKFRDGWNAAQQELPRSYCGSTFDTRPFGAGATVRLHFSDSEEAEKWWVSITGRR